MLGKGILVQLIVRVALNLLRGRMRPSGRVVGITDVV